MSVRLKIGTYIVDAAETGSTSTTTGVRLLTQNPGFSWSEDRNSAEVVVPIHITRDTLANYKASRDELINALTKTVNADVVFESAAGTTFKDWLVSAGAWHRVNCRVEVENENDSGNDVSALAAVVITIERAGVSSGSAGDPTNATTPVLWSFALDSHGLGSAAADCTFETRADAANWVQTMRDGTGHPDWMGSAYRFATAQYQKEQQQNQADPVPDEAYSPAAVTVVFVALPSAFAGNSAFDDVVSMDYEVSGSPRGALDEEAGNTPGYDVVISGTIQFKTEADSDYDSNDSSSVSGSDLISKAEAVLDAIESDAQTRRNLTWERLDDPVIVPTHGGLVTFAITAITGDTGRITVWSESVEVQRTPRDRVILGSKGARVHKHRLGPELRVRHNLSIEAFSPQQYKPLPFIDGNDRWFEENFAPSKPKVLVAEGAGKTRYQHAWAGQWLFLDDATGIQGRNYEDIAGAV